MRNRHEAEGVAPGESEDYSVLTESPGSDVAVPGPRRPLLMTVEEVALLWFGDVGDAGSNSAHCQRIRRLIPHRLPAHRIGNRWYVLRAAAETWAATSDGAQVTDFDVPVAAGA